MQYKSQRLAICLFTAFFAVRATVAGGEEKEVAKNPLLGTWELVQIRYDDATDYTDFPKEHRRLKLITDTHWSWVEYDTTGPKQVKIGGGGPYTYDGDTSTETIEFATGPLAGFLNKKVVFKIRIEGDKCFASGKFPNNRKIEDVWQRVKLPTSQAPAPIPPKP